MRRALVRSSILCIAVGCFTGEATEHLPCEGDHHCGDRQSCIDGYCNGPGPNASSSTASSYGEDLDTSVDETATIENQTCFGCPDCTSTSIQDAVDEAPSGGTVTVCSGTYYESLHVYNKTLTLQAPPGEDVVVNGGDQGAVALIELTSVSPGGTAYEVTVRNIALENGSVGVQFHGYPGILRIHDSRITKNGNWHGGIFANNPDSDYTEIEIINSEISQNNAPELGGAVWHAAGDGIGILTIRNSTISSNSGSGAIYIGDGVDARFEDSSLHGNSTVQTAYGSAVHMSGTASLTMDNVDFDGNSESLGYVSAITVTGGATALASSCDFTRNYGGGVETSAGSTFESIQSTWGDGSLENMPWDVLASGEGYDFDGAMSFLCNDEGCM